MKVWVVIYSDYDFDEIIGIYRTKEAAYAYIDNEPSGYKKVNCLTVEEHEVK